MKKVIYLLVLSVAFTMGLRAQSPVFGDDKLVIHCSDPLPKNFQYNKTHLLHPTLVITQGNHYRIQCFSGDSIVNGKTFAWYLGNTRDSATGKTTTDCNKRLFYSNEYRDSCTAKDGWVKFLVDHGFIKP